MTRQRRMSMSRRLLNRRIPPAPVVPTPPAAAPLARPLTEAEAAEWVAHEARPRPSLLEVALEDIGRRIAAAREELVLLGQRTGATREALALLETERRALLDAADRERELANQHAIREWEQKRFDLP